MTYSCDQCRDKKAAQQKANEVAGTEITNLYAAPAVQLGTQWQVSQLQPMSCQ